MKHRMIQLSLLDEIIAQVDLLAEKTGRDRSGTINQILEDYFLSQPPDEKTKEMTERIATNLALQFQALVRRPDRVIVVKSAIRHEYRPEIRYIIQVNNRPHEHSTHITAVLRSNDLLALSQFNHFLKQWIEIEHANPSKAFAQDADVTLENGRYSRSLRAMDASISGEMLSNAISAYVREFDDMLKLFMLNEAIPREQLEQKYRAFLNTYIF